MGKLAWYINRLRAMSPREVIWRVKQKRLQHSELSLFREHRLVTTPLYPEVEKLNLTCETVAEKSLDSTHTEITAEERITLLGGFEYDRYATDWHAGFNTSARWPLVMSYKLEYKQRDDIGDARINWELNRHRQFVSLAAAGKVARLEYLLDDWTEKNPFLWGISWTSPMEIALRSISWMTAARILRDNKNAALLVGKLLVGVANMTEYLRRHESGFSSANNHLIVEVATVAMAGLLFRRDETVAHSLAILDRELTRQVSADGVDLESSLHYHGFVMEAYLLVWREMKAAGLNDIGRIELWRGRLEKMARFVAASCVSDKSRCVFGDDDEARILAADGEDYYDYLLDLYAEVAEEDVRQTPHKGVRESFKEGGYSFLRSGAFYVGIDHAPLGFGSIAAHGHNDILSFQLFVSGQPLLVDPATYLYHIDKKMRDLLRSTRMHNTVTINRQEQSQMLGAFLWGKKAEARLLDIEANGLTASVKGLSGVTHTRRWQISSDEKDRLTVTDRFDRECHWETTFLVATGIKVDVDPKQRRVIIDNILSLETQGGEIFTERVKIANGYGKLVTTVRIAIVGNSRENCVSLQSL